MPKFYFHVREDKVLFVDKRGGNFPDVKSAWEWAHSDAKAMLDEGHFNSPAERLWVEIEDAGGTLLATLPFARVVN